ncbi:MAG: hypothetical protein PHY80_00775 [Rickettsiales bacterium]|nr:hypothetical protein [Rickettsiales bacterium]
MEEAFLFIKTKIKNKKTNIKNFPKEYDIPNLNREIKIELDEKFYDFYSLQPKNEKPFYINSPLFCLIKRYKDDIFDNILSILLNYNFKIKIGLELEFYVLNNLNKIDILRELKKILQNVENIETERGKNQFEIKTKPYTDLNDLVFDYQIILKELNNFCISNNLSLNFDALPFNDDCGSSLQINLSLVDEKGNNIFSRTKIDNNLVDSDLMLNCIGGLLNNLNQNLLFYIKNEKCLKRFDLEQNIKIKNLDKYPAPTFISWGINNRTASIRIPTPSIINLEKYIEEDNKNRRIEFRVPSASADLTLTLIGVLSSLINGIENNITPSVEKNSFDITITNDNLEQIENNIDILNDIFKINENILFFNKR